eukprot:gb/GECG01014362.1/.p1 GENE.gb/GECG01014362.1/~~gb/GECG01014362.1/.p1  ORF type:complete len:847 (+),score=134.88 gb/GECG01014362.1/:1-2541(+)
MLRKNCSCSSSTWARFAQTSPIRAYNQRLRRPLSYGLRLLNTNCSAQNIHHQPAGIFSSLSSISTAPQLRTTGSNAVFASSPLARHSSTMYFSSSSNTGETEEAAPKKEQPEERILEGQAEKHSFQAETKELLSIVTNALYTDRHVFIRELISNAADAAEKLRHRQTSGESVIDPSKELEIRIETDEASGMFSIYDSGVGLDHDELVENLGTIAHSGSKKFLEKLKEQKSANDIKSNLIGQFGVGFYSTFMVAEEVKVYSLSGDPDKAKAHMWYSKGDGAYEIYPAENVSRGTKIVAKLKEDAKEFANEKTVEETIQKYSNYVNFPIYLNGRKVNSVQAVWALPPSQVTDEMYNEFYKYKTKAWDNPLYRLHFQSDAPIDLKALFFVPEMSEEGFGLGRMKAGVDLYSKRVLIEPESKVMPEWLRFLKGVVDSEDLPLNISREGMQDSSLLRRIRSVLTRKVLRFLEGEIKNDRQKYEKFFNEFGTLLKEGACSDQAYQTEIAKLLLFESSALPAGQLTTLDEYISRSKPGQNQIYYLVAPHRGLADASPYMEAFKPKDGEEGDTEVLYLYNPIDDFVMNNLNSYNGRKLLTIESSEAKPEESKDDEKKPDSKDETEKSEKDEAEGQSDPLGAPKKLSKAMISELSDWLTSEALPQKLKAVKSTNRLRSSPAVITDHESSSLRRMMRMMDAQQRKDSESPRAEDNMLPKQTLEINPDHPIIRRMYSLMHTQTDVARSTAEQLFDNAIIAAGLMDDPRGMLPRLNSMMEQMLGVTLERDTLKGSHEKIVMDKDPEGRSKRHADDKEVEFEATKEAIDDAMADEAVKSKINESLNNSSETTDYVHGKK